ncbi:MAG: ClC family H(+)/Cl(-) exchange transporter [Tissierellia bacterium]|nr:ClC family H(+)/Cl(-) exchange transporter [Tissierellia bacterium]
MTDSNSMEIKYFLGIKKRVVFDGFIVGLFAGIVAVLYRHILSLATKLSDYIYLNANTILDYMGTFLLILLLGSIVAYLIKKVPLASGSGIPQVQGEIYGLYNMNPLSLIAAKFTGGIMANIAGLSLGREGPSIQLGAACGKLLAKILKRDEDEEQMMISAGTGAGLAAAFNAPISGVLFTVEELHKNITPVFLISAMIASVVADYISKHAFGMNAVFSFHVDKTIPLKYYAYIVILGLFTGLGGVIFNRVLLKVQSIYKGLKIKSVYHPIIAFLIAGILGFSFRHITGGGHELMENIVHKAIDDNGFIILIIVSKLLFTSICYGSKAIGGIFLPVLVLGGLMGVVSFNILDQFALLDSNYLVNFVILAMAGYLTGVVRSPLLSVMLVAEMTGTFVHVLSLCIVSVTAYLTCELFKTEPIYESLLKVLIDTEGINKNISSKYKKVLAVFKLSEDSYLVGEEISNVEFPHHALLVSIERNNERIVPTAETKLEAYDKIIFASDHEGIFELQEFFE